MYRKRAATIQARGGGELDSDLPLSNNAGTVLKPSPLPRALRPCCEVYTGTVNRLRAESGVGQNMAVIERAYKENTAAKGRVLGDLRRSIRFVLSVYPMVGVDHSFMCW